MKRSFRVSLFALFAVSVVIPLLVMGGALSYYFTGQQTRAAEQNTANLLYAVSENIRIYLDDLQRTAMLSTVYTEAAEFYRHVDGGVADTYESYRHFRAYHELTKRLLTLSRQDILGVAYIPFASEGDTIYVADVLSGFLRSVPGYDYRAQPWCDQVLAGDGAAVFVAVDSLEYYQASTHLVGSPVSPPDQMFSVIRVSRNADLQPSTGIVKVDASPGVIEDIFRQVHTDENSVMLLLDAGGRVVCSTRGELNFLAEYIGRDTGLVEAGQETYRVATERIETSGWRLVYLHSFRDIRAQSLATVALTAAAAALCLVAAFLIFGASSRRMTAQVGGILHTMQSAAGGDLEAKVQVDARANRDLRVIATQLNDMTARLREHIDREYKAVISQRNAEYLALQTQISPHFFYNTLGSFISLNRLGEKRLLEDSILRLTTFFRYTCAGESGSTVAGEFDFIRQYLGLQQLRFDDRLVFRIAVAPAVAEVPIPRLLVQPLVENAVVHGMEPSDQPILIEIDAAVATSPALGDFILISVVDNGVGFDPKSLPGRRRVGLANVGERLELFSRRSAMVVKSRPGCGTACHLLLPRERGENAREDTHSR